MSGCRGELDVRVYFVVPANSRGWDSTSLIERARQIHGVSVLLDKGGANAKAYGVATSGQTLLFDCAGKLVFKGGITASRGHEGQSAGRDTIEEFVLHGRLPTRESPVFGCALGDLGYTPKESK